MRLLSNQMATLGRHGMHDLGAARPSFPPSLLLSWVETVRRDFLAEHVRYD